MNLSKKETYYWGVFLVTVIAVSWYLINFASVVAREQDSIFSTLCNPMSKYATIKTNFGDITVELLHVDAPETAKNFTKLACDDFYKGTRFHRVIKNFMIQGGDPFSKNPALQARWGMGGPGYQFADEIDQNSELYQMGYARGTLAMANSGPNTNGSQFFIVHKDTPLPPNYTIFGRVTAGMETVDAIAENPTDGNDRPIKDVMIEDIAVR